MTPPGLAVVAAALCLLLLTSCVTNIPQIDGKIYGFDPVQGAIVRTQAGESISCKSQAPDIREYRAMHRDTLQKIFEVMQQCKDWGGTPLMSEMQLKALIQSVAPDAPSPSPAEPPR